jgi:hypothetical protein
VRFDSERKRGIHHFRKSSYDMWDESEEPEPEEAVEDSLRTQCYLALRSVVCESLH